MGRKITRVKEFLAHGQAPSRLQDSPDEELRYSEAQTGALVAFTNANQQTPSRAGNLNPFGGTRGMRPERHDSSRQNKGSRQKFHLLPGTPRNRTNEQTQQHQQGSFMNQTFTSYQEGEEQDINRYPISNHQNDQGVPENFLRTVEDVADDSETSPVSEFRTEYQGPKTRVPSNEATSRSLFHLLHQVQLECPSVYSQDPPKDLEEAVFGLIRAYKSIYPGDAGKSKEYEDLISRLEKENIRLDTKLTVLKDEYERRETKLDGKIEWLEAEIERLKSEHESQTKALKRKHVENNKENDRILDAELTKLKTIFDREKLQLQQSFKTKMESYEKRLNDIGVQHSNEKEQMSKTHIAEMASLSSVLSSEQEKFNVEVENLKKEHVNEKIVMREAHDAEIVKLEIQQLQEYRSLRDENEALKSTLVKKDHFKAMSDRELAQRFQDIASEVEDFARLRWDLKYESTWPFKDVWFRTSENERRAKQFLLENNLWVILYERIFCTPFRVLGDEGRVLEREWIHNYGQATGELINCPRPSKSSEKWRYERMKECLEMTSQPLMSRDPNQSSKQGYESSVRGTTNALLKELKNVVSVNDNDEKRMSELVEKAAKMWLEVGQQRCRVFLLMSESGKEPLRSEPSSLDRDRMQDLVVMPELRRMGNSQGERLERNELVLDCAGRFTVFKG